MVAQRASQQQAGLFDRGREGGSEGWMDGWMDGWMGGWVGGWVDGKERNLKIVGYLDGVLSQQHWVPWVHH